MCAARRMTGVGNAAEPARPGGGGPLENLGASDDLLLDNLGLAAEHLDRAAREAADSPLSLYFHLPFCREMCRYCGCNVVIAPQDKVSVPYMDVLKQDIEINAKELGKK